MRKKIRKKWDIDKIGDLVTKIKKAINDDYKELNTKEKLLENVEVIPSPFDIAKYFGIRCIYKELEEGVPSFFERKTLTIYISNQYKEDGYIARHLCAHELGHFFLHDRPVTEMNKFSSKAIEEYEANVFSILLMPQIMGGQNWRNFTSEELNALLYDKVFKYNR